MPISRHANCPDCFTELRCCRLCVDFDPGVAEQCREDRADPPSNKEGANFCEFFRPRGGAFAEKGAARGDAARARLDALFGGTDDVSSEVSQSEDDARAKLESLFKPKE